MKSQKDCKDFNQWNLRLDLWVLGKLISLLKLVYGLERITKAPNFKVLLFQQLDELQDCKFETLNQSQSMDVTAGDELNSP